ncbi:hypothetical protein [Streptomyces bambusae]|nr:hypothetical protein [Streptomyces bambusae]
MATGPGTRTNPASWNRPRTEKAPYAAAPTAIRCQAWAAAVQDR